MTTSKKRSPLKGYDFIKALAKSSGGALVSAAYVNNVTPLKFYCDRHKRTFRLTPMLLKRGVWCPDCEEAKRKRRDDDRLKRFQKYASARGGKLLSTRVLNTDEYLLWECDKGHQWKRVASQIMHDQNWCPFCANKTHDIAQLQEAAGKNGGRCLSKKYFGSGVKHKWECGKGHEFLAKPWPILHGHKWCPKCSMKEHAKKRMKYSIVNFQEHARRKGGRCLSLEYVSPRSKLHWECKDGHQWEALSGNVMNLGSWCPECKRLNMMGDKNPFKRSLLRKKKKKR